MKVVLFNDTSAYHKGCKKVVEYIHNDIKSCGYELVASIPSKDTARGYNSFLVDKLINNADLVIINGEGTMHHDQESARHLLNIIKHSYNKGKQVMLINSLWQSMSITSSDIDCLKNIYICVREERSQKALLEHGIHADVSLDLSYFDPVPKETKEKQKLLVGGFFRKTQYRPEGVPVLSIFDSSWEDCVNILRSTEWFITGRHHEMYAAAKAECPFVAWSGNSWKNESLMETAGVDIPIAPQHSRYSRVGYYTDRCKERAEEYTKLFEWMKKQPKFTVKDKLK